MIWKASLCPFTSWYLNAKERHQCQSALITYQHTASSPTPSFSMQDYSNLSPSKLLFLSVYLPKSRNASPFQYLYWRCILTIDFFRPELSAMFCCFSKNLMFWIAHESNARRGNVTETSSTLLVGNASTFTISTLHCLWIISSRPRLYKSISLALPSLFLFYTLLNVTKRI